MDASNAFISVNRQNALQLCPPFAQILINIYQSLVCLIIPDLVSTKGTTQCDPLANGHVTIYALAVILILRLQSAYPAVSQVWFADDATGVSIYSSLKLWDTFSQLGPLFGNSPNAFQDLSCDER